MADTQKLVTPAERKRRWLKKLAAERASAWRVSVLHPLLDGKTRVETTREVLELEDGICVAWYPRGSNAPSSGALVGTRVVGWVTSTGQLVSEPIENGRMLMWRGGSSGTTTVALLAPMRHLEPLVPLTIFNETMPIEVPPVSTTMHSADSWSDADIEATRHEGAGKRRAG